MGTLICGSASRGITATAIRPTISEASRNNGVSGEAMVAWVSLPDKPRFTAAPVGHQRECRTGSQGRWVDREKADRAALHRRLDGLVAAADVDVIDSKTRGHKVGRNHERGP